MALKPALSPIVLTATQGSADAFVQGSTLTGLTGRQAYNVRSITIELPNIQAVAVAYSLDCSIQVALTRRSKAAIPNMSDSDVIWKWSVGVSFVTSGMMLIPGTEVFYPQIETPIVEETLYLQVDSDATAIANLVVVRLDVELDTMSDIDRLNLITRSLT